MHLKIFFRKKKLRWHEQRKNEKVKRRKSLSEKKEKEKRKKKKRWHETFGTLYRYTKCVKNGINF
jgi:hypothetical protein